MSKIRCAVVLGILMLSAGCGPDTIFVRPGLDTPSRHVYNGHQLLQRGNLDDACREFERARELDPGYLKAYIGLGVALGRKGDIAAGREVMEQARGLTISQEDRDALQDGYRQLDEMQREKAVVPKSP